MNTNVNRKQIIGLTKDIIASICFAQKYYYIKYIKLKLLVIFLNIKILTL